MDMSETVPFKFDPTTLAELATKIKECHRAVEDAGKNILRQAMAAGAALNDAKRPLDEDRVKYEEDFWAEFERVQPRILGALLDGVVGALRGYQQIDLRAWGRLRMSEFARWAEAGCRALGFRDGEFLDAYFRNQARAMELAFGNDPLAQAVELLIEQEGGRWVGNTQPLHHELQMAANCSGKGELLDNERWPRNATWLGRELRKSAAVLRKVRGIEIEFDVDLRKTGEGDKDGLVIRKRK
jgi:hypothetical protein